MARVLPGALARRPIPFHKKPATLTHKAIQPDKITPAKNGDGMAPSIIFDFMEP